VTLPYPFLPSLSTFTLLDSTTIFFCVTSKEARARGDADTFEVSYDQLDLGQQIGKGAFGRVFLARAEAIAGIPGYITVAVKKLKREYFDCMKHAAELFRF
jgi:hypothetical protein